MTAQEELKIALRTVVGPAVRSHGFKGSAATWILTAASGDAAVINVESSQYSSSGQVRCVVNLAVVPEPWLAWQQARTPNVKIGTPKERDGLWRDRLHPHGTSAGTDGWWRITNEREAKETAADITEQLENGGIANLKRLLDRQGLIGNVRDGDLGFFKGDQHRHLFDRAMAILLSDEGASAELDEVLNRLETSPTDGTGSATRALTRWARARAAAHDQSS